MQLFDLRSPWTYWSVFEVTYVSGEKLRNIYIQQFINCWCKIEDTIPKHGGGVQKQPLLSSDKHMFICN